MINVKEYLNNFYKGNKKPSLDAMKFFMKKYNNFEKEMNFIHIAGTNGKGSCTEMISNILKVQGYKVGKFISPHLIRFNERICINNQEISDEELENLIIELNPLIEDYQKNKGVCVTLFELETIMALLYFYRNQVDFIVLETGLGGLYDCTNIITKPLVSIITSIGYDHMHILGNTLPEIAYQKAGIIKEDSETIIIDSEPEVNNVFISECKKKNNNLHVIKLNELLNHNFDTDFQYFDYKNYKNVKVNLKGKIQIQNASLCLETVNILKEKGYKISDESVNLGLSTVIHKGRMEKLSDNPLIIYDGAHNPPAIKVMLDMINMYYANKKRVYIISILKRKDYDKMLKLLSNDTNAIFILTSGNDPERFATSDELYNCIEKYTKKENIYKEDLKTAVLNIISDNKNNTVNLIVGSFYTYGTVIDILNKKEV